MSLLAILLLVACQGEDEPGTDGTPPSPADTDTDADADADADTDTDTDADTDADTDTDTDTGTPYVPPAAVLDASCALSPDNPLRADCQVTTDGTGPIWIDVTLPDGTVRPYVSDGDPTDTEHSILLWGLIAETTYDWDAGGVPGSVTTGPLPPALDALLIDATGSTDAFDAVLRPIACEDEKYLLMVDPEGNVVWFEENGVWSSGMHAYEWSGADRSILVSNFTHFEEIGVDGRLRLTLDKGVDFDETIHHDVARWGPYTYLIFEYRVGDLWVDGVYAFEGTTKLGELRLGDHYPVVGYQGDWSHANGLENGDGGELTMSLLVWDTVLGVMGDPASPDFLDITWSAGGTDSALPGLTYVRGPGPLDTFNGQHNAVRKGDQLWLFDNLSQGISRSARYQLSAKGEVIHEESWTFDTICPIQGGAVPVGDGVLGTCVGASDIRWFQNGMVDAPWTLDLRCGLAPGVGMNRAIPVHIR